MRYTPLNYDKINAIEGTYFPSMVKSYNNKTFAYWERSLFQRAASVIESELPDTWIGDVRDFFYYCIFRFGFIPIFKRDEYGYTFQPATLKGYDWYYQPTTALVANPALKESLKLKIGTECEILKLTPDYQGIWDIICYFAEKLSTLDNAINMSLINNKYPFILGARNKVAGSALKKMLDKVSRGEPAIIYDMKLMNDQTDKTEPFTVWERSHSAKEEYLTSEQLQDMQSILNAFDAEIGIPTVPYAKKERMVSTEAESRQIDAQSRSTIWIECLNSSAEKVKKLYDIPLSFKLRYDPEKEEDNGISDIDNDRPV